MSQPAARVTDMHTCPMQTPQPPPAPPIPHVGGPILPTPPPPKITLIGGLPAATVGNVCVCVAPAPDSIVKGSTGVLISGKPAARQGDQTAHGGVIAAGFPKVMIGDTGSGSGGGGGGGSASTTAGYATEREVAGTAASSNGYTPQREALVSAAESGAPFCEECERARTRVVDPPPQPSPLRNALREAAENGVPFCEECERARAKAENPPPQPSPMRATLQEAADKGVPFCEECERMRAEGHS